MKKTVTLFCTALLFLLSTVAFGQTTYTWTGAVNTAWNNAGNWDNGIPANNANSIVVFNNGTTVTVTAIPTQTINSLIISNNSSITLQAATTNTLTITPGAGNTGIQIASGSSLSNTAASILSITTTNSAQIIDVSGSLTWLGGTFTTTGNTLNVSGTVNFSTGTYTAAASATTLTNISGTWNMNSGTINLLGSTISGTLNMLGGTTNMNNATYPTTVTSTGVVNHTGGTITGSVAGLFFAAGSNYNYLATGALTIPTATWDVASNVNITGITSAATISGVSGQSFGNFYYNCTNQGNIATSFAANGTATRFKGNFNLQSTGAGTGTLSFKSGTTAATINIDGTFNINGGLLNANIGGTAGLTLNMNGGFDQSGGTFNLNTAAIGCILNIGNNFNQTAGTFTQTSTTVSTVNFNLAGSRTYNASGTIANTYLNYVVVSPAELTLNSNLTTAASRTFTINLGATLTLGTGTLANSASGTITNSGSLYLGTNVISGAGAFTNSNTATTFLYIGHADGIAPTGNATGNIQVAGTKTYGILANYIYNGTAAQITGLGYPAAPTGTLTIDNPTSVTLSATTSNSNAVTPLTLNQGLFILGNFNYTLSAATAVIGGNTPSVTNMIVTNGTGQFIKAFPTGAYSFTFPLGDNTGANEYTPNTVSFTANSLARNIGARVVNAAHPSVGGVSNYLNRYWAFTNSTAGTYTYNLDFTYTNDDVVGDATLMLPSRWNATTWTPYAGSVASNAIAFSGTLNQATLPLSGTMEFTGREGEVYYYRSIANGNWTTPATWEIATNPDFTGAVGASDFPTSSNSARIIIASGTKVTVGGAVTANDLDVFGTLESTVTNPFTYTGTFIFKDGSVYEHNFNGGALPLPTLWEANSTCKIIGTTNATALANFTGRTFGNFEINSPSQTSTTFSLGLASVTTIAGNFNVVSTNSGTTIIKSGTAGTCSLVINGNYEQTGGNITLNSAATVATTLTVNGDFIISAGTLNISTAAIACVVNFNGNYNQSGTGTLTQTSTTVSTLNFGGINKTYTQSGGTLTNTNLNYTVNNGGNLALNTPWNISASRSVTIAVNSTLSLNGNDITFANAGSMASNGTLICGTSLVKNTTGNTTFSSNSGSTLIIGSPDGITATGGGAVGNIQVSSTRTFNAGANYVYNGTTNQVTGSGLPTALTGTLTIDNPVSVTLTNATTASNAGVALTMNQGLLILGNNNLTLSAATSSIGGNAPSASNMIVTNGTGVLAKAIGAAPYAFTFPVGDNTGTVEYSPVRLDFSTGAARTISVNVTDGRHPQDLLVSDFLSRYWTITSNSVAAYTLTAEFTYAPSDINGDENNLKVNRYDLANAVWAEYASTVSSPVVSATGITHVAPLFFTAANVASDYTARANAPYHYRSKQSGDWASISTWEVSTDPAFTSPAPIDATVVPTATNSDGILISTGHTVSVAVATTGDDITVEGTLNINSGITFTVANGAAAMDMIVNGTVNNTSTITTTGAVEFAAGSVYNHLVNGGTIPTATWNTTSTVNITAITNGVPTQLNQNFGNILWNCSAQSATINLTTFPISVNQLEIRNTNNQVVSNNFGSRNLTSGTGVGDLLITGGRFAVRGGALNTSHTLTVRDLIIDNSSNANAQFILDFSTGTTTALTIACVVNRDLIINLPQNSTNANVIQYRAGVANTEQLTLSGNFTQTGTGTGAINRVGATGTQTFVFLNGTNSIYSATKADIFGTLSSFNITGATVDFGNSILTYTGNFSLTNATAHAKFGPNGYLNNTGAFTTVAGSTLSIGSADGIAAAPATTGNIRNTSTRTFIATANYIFNGTAAQVTGDGFANATVPGTANVNTLTIDNAAGVTLSKHVVATTALNLNQGVLDLGNFDLVLLNPNNATAIGGNTPTTTNMVVTNGTGRLIKYFAATSTVPFTWPLGDNVGTAEYTPPTITFAANPLGYLGMQVIDAKHPSDASTTDYLSRYWSSSIVSGLATHNYTFSAVHNDAVGTAANIKLNHFNNNTVSWSENAGSTTTSSDITSTSGLTNATFPLNGGGAGAAFTGRDAANVVTYYQSAASGNWSDASTWEISSDPNFVSPPGTPAGGAPSATNNTGIFIRNGHTVTVTAAANADQMTIDAGGVLAINALQTFTVADGTGTDLQVDGAIINSGTLTLTGTASFNSGGSYTHALNGGVLPTTNATWDANSTLTITGTTTTNPTGYTGRTFGNFVWNNVGQTSATGAIDGSFTVNGDFTIQAGTFSDIAAATITGATGKTFTVGAAGTFTTLRTAAWYPSDMTVVLNNGSTVNYNATTAFTLTGAPDTYWNLGFRAGAVVKTLPASTPFTVLGDLIISAGTLADNGNTITVNGNVTGGATHSGTGKIELSGGTSTHLLAAILGNVDLNDTNGAATSGATTLNGTFNVMNGSLTLGAFAFTGAATSTLNINTIVDVTSVTGAKTFGNITVNNGGTFVNSANSAATIAGNIQNDGTFTAGTNTYTFNTTGKTINGANSVTFATMSVNTSVSITNNGTLNVTTSLVGAGTLVNGASANLNLSGTSTITNLNATAAGNTVTYNGTTAAQTAKATTYQNLILNNIFGSANTIGAATSNGTLTLQNGTWQIGNATLNINGDLVNGSGSLTGGTTSTIIVGNSGSAPAITLPAITNNLLSFTLNRNTGVTLGAPLTIGTASTGVLTLSNGQLTTSSTNLISVLNTTAASVVYTAGSYVNGPLARNFTTTSTGTNLFPVGKSANNLFELLTPSITSGTITITVEAFDATTGGSNGLGLNLSGAIAKHWKADISGTGTLGAYGTARLTDAGVTSTHVVGFSPTLSGTYNSYGATLSGNTIASTITLPATSGYFVIGGSDCLGNSISTTTYTVGATGDFKKLSEVAGIVNSSIICGHLIFELLPDYVGTTGESLPIVFNQLNYNGGPWNVTVRPSAAVTTSLVTSGDPGSATPLINFNGVDYLTFDGVPGGSTGSNVVSDGRWIIRNTRTATIVGSTIQLINDATYNNLKYLQIEGQNITGTSGTIVIGTSTVATGNDYNSITYNTIRDRSDATGNPVNAIYAAGTLNRANDNITIDNNHIFNYWSAGGSNSGILISSYNNTWSITNNSFYQTASRAATKTAIDYGIQIDNSTDGNNFNVTNNYIGGGAPLAAGTAWTITGTAQIGFIGISVNIQTSATSLVQNNTVTNFNIATSRVSAFPTNTFTGIISASNGATTINNNVIGAATGNGAITINNVSITNLSSMVVGVGHSTSTGDVNITNNSIGSFTLNSSSGYPMTFNGIRYGQGGSSSSRTISGNLIGSLTTANSINVNTGSNISSAQDVVGITMTAGANAVSITNNTIANMHNNRPSISPGQTVGINSSFASNTITGNTIFNLSSTSNNGTAGASAAVAGIVLSATSANNHLISQNTIYGLKKSSGATAVSVIGIYYGGSTGTNNNVSRNLIHSLSSNATGSLVSGIYMGAGAVTVSNNMIRLGIDETGTNITTAITFQGIVKDNTSTNNFIYYNSVYIGGNGVAATANPTYAFRRMQTNANDNVRNNIFFNARSNASTGGNHYGVFLNNSTTLVMSHNLIYTNGTGGLLGRINTTDYTNLSAWNATGFGGNSVSDDPYFIAPTAATPNLNLTVGSTNPAESAAIIISGIEDDYEAVGVRTGYPQSNTYGGGTAPDIGADETDMMAVDKTAPEITNVTSVANISVACGTTATVNISATVTDAGSGVATGLLQPQLWWRLSTLTYAAAAPVSVSGNTYNYELNLTGLVAGQVYHYYIAAQDNEGNIGYSHSGGGTPIHSDVATFPSTINTAPATFSVITSSPLSGTVTVGSGGDYATLTQAGGLFNAININGLNGNLTVEIISNTTETGNQTLNQWTEYCGTGYYVYIRPSSASVKTLSGSLLGMGMFGIYASRVIIDGSFNGSGRYLKFENTYASTGGSENSVFRYGNGSTTIANDTIRNCDIVGNTTKVAGAVLHMHNVSGLVIDNNLLHGGSNWAMNIIRADASSNIVISNNEIYNFLGWSGGIGTRSYGVFVNTGNGSNWTITGNSIYNTGINGQNVQTALAFLPGSSSTNNIISNNWIGGSSAQCGTGGSVAFWGNSYTTTSCAEVTIRGIHVNAGSASIDSNNISNIYLQGCDYVGFVGIHVQGATATNMNYNVLGTGSNGQPDNTKMIRVAGGGCSSCQAPGYIYGIWNQSTSTTTTTYNRNDFYYLWQSGAYWGGSVQCLVHQAANPAIVTNNRINGPQATGLGLVNSFGIRIEPTTSTSNNIINDNFVAGPYLTTTWASGYGSSNYGISVRMLSSRTVSGSINRNVVWDMRNADYGGTGGTYGIILNGNSGGNGNWDIINNQITLKNNGSTANCVGLYGIDIMLNSASTTNVLYNTVYISGSNGGAGLAGADFTSAAFFRMPNGTGNAVGDNITLKNNIFVNYRLVSTTAVTGHFAIANYGSSNFATNWTASDNNFLAVNDGSKSYIGIWGTTVRSTFANWQTSSGKDLTSYTATPHNNSNFSLGRLNADNLFLNPLSDLHISLTDGESYKFVDARATPISVTTDFDNDPRSSTAPTIGADEIFTVCPEITINTSPAPNSICEGSNTFFTVDASGVGISYQWQVNTGSGFANITNGGNYSGAQTDQLYVNNTPSSFDGYEYRAVISSTCTTAVNSASATLTVNSVPSVVDNPVDASVIAGNNTSFSVTASGSGTISYQWQVSTNGGSSWSNVSNSAPYSNANTATLDITNVTLAMNNYQYRVIISSICIPPDTSTVALLTVTSSCSDNTWTGAINTLWEEAGNWSCNIVPDTSINVIIPNVTNDPVINIDITGGTKNITIQTGANLTMVNNATLEVSGNFNNEGVFSFSGTSIVVLLGERIQTIKSSWTSGTNNSFNVLTINKSTTSAVTLIDDLNVLTKTNIDKGEFVVPEDVVARSKKVELKDKLLIQGVTGGTKAGEFRVNE